MILANSGLFTEEKYQIPFEVASFFSMKLTGFVINYFAV